MGHTVVMDDRAPAAQRSAIDAWIAVYDDLAPGVVEGMYLVGSGALGDWRPASDIDIVAFVADPTDADTVDALESAHTGYRDVPDRPLVDGPFLSWADVTAPPASLQRPWTLDGEFRFDGECFEINPVTWFTLATSGVAFRGPPASELGVVLDAQDRRAWVREIVDTYWRGVLGQVESALGADPMRDAFDPAVHEWCALGIARMAYTFERGDVTSKTGAGEWLIDRRPAHAAVLREAIAIRRGVGSDIVGRESVGAVVALLADQVGHISGS